MSENQRHVRREAQGHLGAVSAAHPLAVSAGQTLIAQGGSAMDALIAAQAALCVVLPQACGLGGDALVLVREAGGSISAVNGTGASPSHKKFHEVRSDGTAVTVPGLVHAWQEMSTKWGSLSLGACLAPAIALAREGAPLGRFVALRVEEHRARLEKGKALDWAVARSIKGARVRQPELAALLQAIADQGAHAFYDGPMAEAVEAAVTAAGGLLSAVDLSAHETVIRAPVSLQWRGGTVHVQPPMTQGVLLPMCLQHLEALGDLAPAKLAHICIELTQAAFAHRERVAEGEALLKIALEIDAEKASKASGPRAYLHTAGAAAADRNGLVASSLVSVFDEFGSGILVPEGGFVLNNRAEGFTQAPNDAAPSKRPVHTLAPALWEKEGVVRALATPGADGQIQTLLQVMSAMELHGLDLANALHAPRWRSEDGKLLIADNHPDKSTLRAAGHDLEERADDDSRFGGMVSASYADGIPRAASDWRREVWHGVV